MKLSVPDVLADFKVYHAANSVWGVLHIVLDDGNMADHHVRWCVEEAQRIGDNEGERLARVLLTMSTTQRRKLARLA